MKFKSINFEIIVETLLKVLMPFVKKLWRVNITKIREHHVDIKTRGQKKVVGQSILDDPKAFLNNASGNQVEAQKLIEDQIFHDFVEVQSVEK